MKLSLFVSALMFGILCMSCSGGGSAQKDPHAGVVIVTEWGQGPGIEAYADYSYSMGALFGAYAIDVYNNAEKGSIVFVVDKDQVVIASLDTPKSDLKPNQYMSYRGAIKDYDPKREYWKDPFEVDPYYVVIYEDDRQDNPHFTTIVKAWRFDENKKAFVEVPTEGLAIVNDAYGV